MQQQQQVPGSSQGQGQGQRLPGLSVQQGLSTFQQQPQLVVQPQQQHLQQPQQQQHLQQPQQQQQHHQPQQQQQQHQHQLAAGPLATNPQLRAQFIQHLQPQAVQQQAPRLGTVPQHAIPNIRPPAVGTALPEGAAARPPMRMTEAAPAARKYNAKKRKLPEAGGQSYAVKPTPQMVEQMPQSELFTQLLEAEQRIAATISRMRAQMKQTIRSTEHVHKKLRLYVRSEHFNQEEPTAQEPAGWQLKIWGKLVDPADKGEMKTAASSARPSGPPMSSYIRRMVVRMDPQPGSNEPATLLWNRATHKGPFKESFEIRRQGNTEVAVQIEVEPDSQPELWDLSDALAAVYGAKQATRPALLHTIWAIIRQSNLQATDQPGHVRCEMQLAGLFGEGIVIPLSSISTRLDAHLRKRRPAAIPYTVRVSGANPAPTECYDIDLFVPLNPYDQSCLPFIDRLPSDPEVDKLQSHVNALVRTAREHSRRRTFLLGFSSSPVDFVNALVASQARDLRAAHNGGPAANILSMRRSQFFKGKWVEDAVLRYLHRRISAST